MKIFIKYLIVLCLLVSALAGCKKTSSPEPVPVVVPDTTKPTITITKPTVGQAFAPGSTIPFQATFSDNEKLGTYDIAISKVVTGGLILKVVPTSLAYSYTKSSTSFNSGVKQQEIILSDITPIPANTATNIVTPGKYNLKVTCVDGSNNSTSTTIEININ